MEKEEKRFLVYFSPENEYEEVDTIEEARLSLKDVICCSEEGLYRPDADSCKIYELKEVVKIKVLDSKENYKYLYEEDVPEGEDEADVWPYSNDFDEIWEHELIDVNPSLKIADIRNKLTPFKNLIAMLEAKPYCNVQMRGFIKKEIENCKKALNYLSKTEE